MNKKKYKKRLRAFDYALNLAIAENQALKNRLLQSFGTYMCIAGMQGSGKTSYIVKNILPKLSEYFLITNSNDRRNWYKDVHENNIIDEIKPSTAKKTIFYTRKEFLNIIEGLISDEDNKGCVFIFDDMGAFDTDWFIRSWYKHRFQFIITVQCVNLIFQNKKFDNMVQLYYLLKQPEPIVKSVDILSDIRMVLTNEALEQQGLK